MGARAWVTERLKGSGAPFEEVHHKTAVTAQDLAHREHTSGRRVAKVVAVYADGKPVMLVLPATHRVALGRVREALGAAQLRMAEESDLARLFPDSEVGAEPPIPHDAWVPVLMDEAMRVNGEIVFSGGTHQDGIKMSFARWYDLVRPSVASFAVETGSLPRRPTEWG